MYIIKSYIKSLIEKHMQLVAEKYVTKWKHLLNHERKHIEIFHHGLFFTYRLDGRRVVPKDPNSVEYFCTVYTSRSCHYTKCYSTFRVLPRMEVKK